MYALSTSHGGAALPSPQWCERVLMPRCHVAGNMTTWTEHQAAMEDFTRCRNRNAGRVCPCSGYASRVNTLEWACLGQSFFTGAIGVEFGLCQDDFHFYECAWP